MLQSFVFTAATDMPYMCPAPVAAALLLYWFNLQNYTFDPE